MSHLLPTRTALTLVSALVLTGGASFAKHPLAVPPARVFVQADGGFELYMTTALEKKHVPVSLVTDKDKADYELGASHSGNAAGAKLIDHSSGDIVLTCSASGRNERRAEQNAANACAERVRELVATRHRSLKSHVGGKLKSLVAKDPAFQF